MEDSELKHVDIEGFGGDGFSPTVKEPIRVEDRRLHLVELNEGVPVNLPDYNLMSKEEIMKELAKINLVVLKRNYWG